MNENHYIDKITHTTFTTLLNQYPALIPPTHQPLENERYLQIPHTISHRNPPYLTKPDLATLTNWKLTHGKPRPTLPALIRSNAAQTVTTTTRAALQNLTNPITTTSLRTTLDHLCALRGVGPATASLLLSVHNPTHIPFFSDELYQWSHFRDPPGRTKATAGKGWERRIEYSATAYLSLYERVEALRVRMQEVEGEEVRALEVEKVGYVLGRTGGRVVEAVEQQLEARDGMAGAMGKRGGRKRKAVELEAQSLDEEPPTDTTVAESKNPPKKRGRKRKAGV